MISFKLIWHPVLLVACLIPCYAQVSLAQVSTSQASTARASTKSDLNRFYGNYVSNAASVPSIKEIRLRNEGGKVKVHAWLSGYPNSTDLGEALAEIYKAPSEQDSTHALVNFSSRTVRGTLTITGFAGRSESQFNNLSVQGYLTMPNGSCVFVDNSLLADVPKQAYPNLHSIGKHVSGIGSGLVDGRRFGNLTIEGSGGSEVPDIGPYAADLARRVKRAWFPPQGKADVPVQVEFKIHRRGELSNLHIIKSGGLPVVDQAALEAVRNAAPYRPLPIQAPPVVNVTYTFGCD